MGLEVEGKVRSMDGEVLGADALRPEVICQAGVDLL